MASVDVISSAPSPISIGGNPLVPGNGTSGSEGAVFPDLLALIQQLQAANIPVSNADSATDLSAGIANVLLKVGLPVVFSADFSTPVAPDSANVDTSQASLSVAALEVSPPLKSEVVPRQFKTTSTKCSVRQFPAGNSPSAPSTPPLSLLEELKQLVASLVQEDAAQASPLRTAPEEGAPCLAPPLQSPRHSSIALKTSCDKDDSATEPDTLKNTSGQLSTEAVLALVQQWLAQLLKPQDKQIPESEHVHSMPSTRDLRINVSDPKTGGRRESVPELTPTHSITALASLVASSVTNFSPPARQTHVSSTVGKVVQAPLTLSHLPSLNPFSSPVSSTSATNTISSFREKLTPNIPTSQGVLSDIPRVSVEILPQPEVSRDVLTMTSDWPPAPLPSEISSVTYTLVSEPPLTSTSDISLPAAPAVNLLNSASNSISLSKNPEPQALILSAIEQVRGLFAEPSTSNETSPSVNEASLILESPERLTHADISHPELIATPQSSNPTNIDPRSVSGNNPSEMKLPTSHEFWQSNGPTLTHALLQDHPGGHTFSVEISPPELGPLRIEVQRHSGHLFASLEARDPATQQLLRDTLPQLHQSLEQSGVKVERLDVRETDAFWNSGGSGNSLGGGNFSRQAQPQVPREDLSRPHRRPGIPDPKESEPSTSPVVVRRSRAWERGEIDLHV